MRLISNPTKEAWLTARHQGLGASDAPIILGLSRFKSPYSLYLEKLGLIEATSAESEAAEWGLLLEGPIAMRFQRETKRQVAVPEPFTIYQHDTIDWLNATLDRWQVDAANQTLVPLELKTSNWALDAKWKEEAPLEYVVQVQHQLAVTGAAWASIAGLIGGQKFVWMDIPRDEEFIKVLLEKEGEFWQRLIDRNPPDVDSSAQTQEALKKLYATETGESVSLGAEFIELDERYQEVKSLLKTLEEEERGIKNQLLAKIGSASAGFLPNDVVYSLKTQTVKEHVVKESTFRVLRRKGPK